MSCRKNQLIKRIFAWILCMVMVVSSIIWMPDNAQAESIDLHDEYEQQYITVYEEDIEIPDMGIDMDDMYEAYVGQVLGLYPDFATYSIDVAGKHLTGNEATVYQIVKPELAKIAEGKSASTEIEIPLIEFLDKSWFSQADLGGIPVVVNGSFNPQAVEQIKAILSSLYDKQVVGEALMADCPYELYWRGSTYGSAYSFGYGAEYRASEGGYVLTLSDVIGIFYFSVDSKYTGSTAHSVDTAKTGAAAMAAANAKQIVSDAADLSDYQKLDHYRQVLCDLITYDTVAAGTTNPSTRASWEIINVFDGDASTNVVCEGYSKAFAYLCELTEFDSEDIYTYTVTGTAGGPHMWNIIHMDDEKNYLVDVTNCDGTSIGAPNFLFLSGYKTLDLANKSYTIYIPKVELAGGGYRSETTFSYKYDAETLETYDWSELVIADSNYDPSNVKKKLKNVPTSFTVCVGTQLKDSLLSDYSNWAWDETSKALCAAQQAGGVINATAIYVGADKDLYSNTTVNVEIVARSHDYAGQTYILNSVNRTHSQKCKICGEQYEPVACTAGTSVIDNVRTASCTVGGTHDEVTYCEVCRQLLSRDTKNDSALGHDFYDANGVVDEAKEECSRCHFKNLNYSGLKITAMTVTYNGKTQTAQIEGLDSTYYTVQGPATSQKKDAGTYEIVLVGQSNYVGTRTITWVIEPKQVTPTIAGSVAKDYDGTVDIVNAKNLSIALEGITADDILTNGLGATANYAFENANAGDEKSVIASNIELTGTAKDNYTLATTSVNANIGAINKINPTGYVIPTGFKGKCGESVKQFVFEDTHFSWLGDWTLDGVGGTETPGVKTYRALYTPDDKDNYNSVEVLIEIESTHIPGEIKAIAGDGVKHQLWCAGCNRYITDKDCYGGEATCAKGKICEGCGKEYDKTKNPNAHTFTNYGLHYNATCVKDAYDVAYCDYCENGIDIKEYPGTATGHSYGMPEFLWNMDDMTCRMVKTCGRTTCNYATEGHVVSDECDVVSMVIQPATCIQNGIKKYTAIYGNYSSPKNVEFSNANAHKWSATINEEIENQAIKEATCTEVGEYHEFCLYCNKLGEKTFTTEEPLGHNFENNVCARCGEETEGRKQLRAFVTRMYTKALQRTTSESEIQYWIDELEAGKTDGAKISEGFLLGEEIASMKLSNEEFINRCYATLFGREKNDAEFAYWMELVEGGMSRRYIAARFCASDEYKLLFATFGVDPGEIVLTDPADQNENITKFANRCYATTLGRNADYAGLNYWADVIIGKKMTALEVAKAFVFSEEFIGKNLNEQEYLEVLYGTFFGRPGDAAGVNYWVGLMQTGMSREAVCDLFGGSEEFAAILATFGLN